MIKSPVPMIGFAAWSGTGKTTLITALIPLLAQRGLRVSVLKHAHHDVEFDRPGKDSHRLRMAGAEQVMVASARRWAIFAERAEPKEPLLEDELARLDPSGADLLIVEGFKQSEFPKIELHRPALGKPLLYPDDDNVIAIASDAELPADAPQTRFDINDPAAIADFLTDFCQKDHP